MKRLISVLLIAALLCAMPLSAKAQDQGLTATNVSMYPTIRLSGGFHWLWYNEFSDEVDENDVPLRQMAFDPTSIMDVVAPVLDGALEALKSLDFNKVVDLLVDAFKAWFGPIQLDNNGNSIADNISSEYNNWDEWQLKYADQFEFTFDWRLDPVENARRLKAYMDRLAIERPGVEKYNFYSQSGGGPVMMAYLKLFDPDLERVASVVFDITMHNGTTMWGELAKRKLMLNTEAVGKLSANSLGGIDLGIELQPLLRILYESGLLEIVERLMKVAATGIINRVYDEILIPMIFTMPVFWSYVPHKDYEAAKKALLSDPIYNSLKAKLDYYRTNVMDHAEDIILDTAKQVKVAVRAGYGMPMWPLGKGAGAQSDGTVDTAYASLGAICATIGEPFGFWYKQAKDRDHDHISPDRMIDASTCLLPEQTWFALDKPHATEHQYGGWYDWFKGYDEGKPTVFSNEEYPQFVRLVGPSDIEGQGIYEPVAEREPQAQWLEALIAVGLWILKIWRWLLRLPLFWA